MKKYIIIIVVIILLAACFWLSPYSAATHLREPKNYSDCKAARGIDGGMNPPSCLYGKKYFYGGGRNSQ